MTSIKQTGNETCDLALDTILKQKQALIFVNTKKGAEKQAEEISKKLPNTQIELAEKILKALPKPTPQCERLSKCVKKGIAFHHAGLHSKQRELIEDSFRNKKIKVICSTPTLAAGLDLPAFRAIIRDTKRYGGKFGMTDIPVLEYMQMAGRAGRPKYDTFGESICIAKSEAEKDNLFMKYILGTPEDIYSKLAVEPVLRTYLLSLIATKFVETKNQILDFFSKTFWAKQYKDLNKLEEIIDKMLNLLEEWGFLDNNKSENSDFISANSINNEIRYNATILGKRVSELYIDPLTAYHLIKAINKSEKKNTNIFSWIQIISHTLEMRPLLRIKTKETDEIMEKYLEYEDYLLENEPSIYDFEYEEFMNSLKTSLMLLDWANEKDDEYLMKTYNTTPGETRVKIDIGEWLLYTAYELARILNKKNILADINKTRFRLKYGVKEELLPLLKLKQIGRARARTLFRNNIKTMGDIKKASPDTLAQLLGAKIATSLKEQVGEKIEIISPGKRLGQTSLSKYKS